MCRPNNCKGRRWFFTRFKVCAKWMQLLSVKTCLLLLTVRGLPEKSLFAQWRLSPSSESAQQHIHSHGCILLWRCCSLGHMHLLSFLQKCNMFLAKGPFGCLTVFDQMICFLNMSSFLAYLDLIWRCLFSRSGVFFGLQPHTLFLCRAPVAVLSSVDT